MQFFTQLKLVNPSEKRLEHLTTQLKWRLQEGQGEAIYEIGVEDNGLLAGLSRDEMRKSLAVLTTMATKLGSEATVLRENLVDGSQGEEDERVVAEVLVRKLPDDQQVNKVHLPLVLVKIDEKYEIELKHDLAFKLSQYYLVSGLFHSCRHTSHKMYFSFQNSVKSSGYDQ